MPLLDIPDNLTKDLITVIRVLSSLKDKGSKAQFIPAIRTPDYLFRHQAVSVRPIVSGTDSAVITVIPAVIRKFDQSADVYLLPVYPIAHRACKFRSHIPYFIAIFNQMQIFIATKNGFRFQFVYKLSGIIHC